MRITKGCTRVVILTQRLAIKIGIPVDPLGPARLALRGLVQGNLRAKLKKHEGNLMRITGRAIFRSGISANRREYRLSRKYPHYPIAPVLHSYLWGIIIVMPRGEAVRVLPKGWDRTPELPGCLRNNDLFTANNSCRFGDTMRFTDYAHEDAEETLRFLFEPVALAA